MYCKTKDGQVIAYPYNPNLLPHENHNTGFPAHINNATMAKFGVYPVKTDADPSFDTATQKIVTSELPSLVQGEWRITKTVVTLTSEEQDELNAKKAAKMRDKRDGYLASTDWTQFNDSPLTNEEKTAWATYRQELRNITDLNEWPNLADEDWPVKP